MFVYSRCGWYMRNVSNVLWEFETDGESFGVKGGVFMRETKGYI